MKTSLEPEDVEAIASVVVEKVKLILSGSGRNAGEDIIFEKKTLAAYLHVSESTINKLVMNKQIPHFKIQSGQSGAVRFNKRDIDKWVAKHTIPEIAALKGKISA
ncbi:MAG: helix-turn-helix domain-containing protein [Dissulfurispiraceae bacterium]